MIILKKLGEGEYANVFLAKNVDSQLVAVKIPKNNISKKKALAWSLQEVSLLSKFTQSNYIMNLLSYELSDTKNYIMIELLGDELNTLVKHYRKYKQHLSINVVKRLLKQLLYGMNELVEHNVLHLDLKLENILFTSELSPIFKQTTATLVNNIIKHMKRPITHIDLQNHIKKYCWVLKDIWLLQSHIKITDFGNAFSQESAIEKKDDFAHARPTRHYISPEILLRTSFWVESDMWSFGCIVYELLTNNVIFDPYRDNTMGVNSMHIACMIKIFGPFPPKMIKLGKKSKRYFTGNKHKYQFLIRKNETLEYLLNYYDVPSKEIPAILEFLKPIFEYDPSIRIKPAQCINSKFLC